MMGLKFYLTDVPKRRGDDTQGYRHAEECHVIMKADIGVLSLQPRNFKDG